MYDTIAAIVPSLRRLSSEAFQGGITTEIFNGDDESRTQVRLFRNPEPGTYAPRFTYWPGDGEGWLKAEFSVPKMARRRPGETGFTLLDNPAEVDVARALDEVDALVREHFGEQFPVRSWKCQRVDYAYNWTVGSLLPVYLAVLQTLRLSTWSRHPYDAAQGVVWKSKSSKGRWVKFYNKGLQLASSALDAPDLLVAPDVGVLRYEVSNYKDAVAYMAEHWFGVGQTVGELVHPGRSLYVMARFFDKLGLDEGSVGAEEYLLFRLAEEFGPVRASTAWYTLTLHSRFGNASFAELELVSRSTYYAYVKELRDHGFLQNRIEAFDVFTADDELVIAKQQLPELHLPSIDTLFSSQNLGEKSPALQRNMGSDVRKNLGILPRVRIPKAVRVRGSA